MNNTTGIIFMLGSFGGCLMFLKNAIQNAIQGSALTSPIVFCGYSIAPMG